MLTNNKNNNCLECLKYGLGFQKLTIEERSLLNSNKNGVKYSAGEIIIKQYSLMDHVFLLKEGCVKVVMETENQRNIILQIISQGNFISLDTLNSHEYSPVSIIALTDCQVCQIRKQTIQELQRKNESFNKTLIEQYGKEILFLYSKINTLGAKNSHGRLSEVLLYLESEQFKEVKIHSLLSRRDLSELAAISIESMNKILKELKNDLIIDMGNKNISILRPDLLERISRVG